MAGLVLPRRKAPSFSAKGVLNGAIQKFSSEDFQGKWLVLFFYPFDYTFVCPTELVAFSEASDQFRALGAEVAAISCDSAHVHLSYTLQSRVDGGVGGLNIPLISDFNKSISRSFGVLVEDEEDELCGAALRALFIIDPTNTVRSVVVNDEAVGRNVKETIRLIQAFQYADKHGETCPANWHPGDDTVKPDHWGSLNFFKKWGKKLSFDTHNGMGRD